MHSYTFGHFIKLLFLKHRQEVYVSKHLRAKSYETNSSAYDGEENIVWKAEGMRSYLCLSKNLFSLSA